MTISSRSMKPRRPVAVTVALSLLAMLTTSPMPASGAPAQGHIDIDEVARQRYGNDATWYRDRIPFFESADFKLDAVYYYRWQLFRAHQRDLGEKGFISTEFLDDVGWQREPYASLNDASGFHIGEGRWLRDRRPVGDYIDFMYTGGNDRHFTDYMADAAWGRYLVDGDARELTRHLPAMQALYEQWNDHLDPAKGLYWAEPLLDATEYTISSIDASGGLDGFFGGDAFRPSINAYMFANARAIARIARLAGRGDEVAARYEALAEAIRVRVERDLWNAPLSHYIDRHRTTNEHVRYWDPIRGRELVGYLPWTFDLASDDPTRAVAWGHLLSPAGLGGAAGMRTVEPSYPHYMQQYRYDGGGHDGGLPECQWNGPVWPYQTTQVLLGMANMLDHYRHPGATRSDYMRLLRQYVDMHYQGDTLNLAENYHPDTGRPIVGLGRSHHYFHSGFVDLVLGGVVGIRPRADDVLEVNPLLPDGNDPQALRWFRVEQVPYHGHLVSITWDAYGTRYGTKGLRVQVDGQEVARRETLGRITVPVARRSPPPLDRSIAQSIQLRRDGYPKGSASSGTDAENVHDAIDGRIWFMPQLGNGWSSEPGEQEQWYVVDFGRPVRLRRAELALFADGGRFAAPKSYHVQSWQGDGWRDLPARADAPLANGITHASWTPITTGKIRVLFRQAPNRAMRLVELKIF